MNEVVKQTSSGRLSADPVTNAATNERPAQIGQLQTLMGVAFSPSETFMRIKNAPSWIAPLLLLIALLTINVVYFNWRVDTDWEQITRNQISRRIEGTGRKMPPEDVIHRQAENRKRIAEFGRKASIFAAPVLYLLMAAIFNFALWLLEAGATFKKVFSVVLWSSVPPALAGTLILVASLTIQDPSTLATADVSQITVTNPSPFLPAGVGPAVDVIVSSLDCLTIWFLILLTIGFAAISNNVTATKKRMAAVVFGLWAISVAGKALLVTTLGL